MHTWIIHLFRSWTTKACISALGEEPYALSAGHLKSFDILFFLLARIFPFLRVIVYLELKLLKFLHSMFLKFWLMFVNKALLLYRMQVKIFCNVLYLQSMPIRWPWCLLVGLIPFGCYGLLSCPCLCLLKALLSKKFYVFLKILQYYFRVFSCVRFWLYSILLPCLLQPSCSLPF